MYCCWQWSCLYCGYARNWPHNSQALFSPSHQYRSTDVRSQHCSSHVPRPTVRDMESARTLSAAATAKSLQLCPTLCDLIDGSPPDSPIPGTLQARTREWGHFLLQCMKVKRESEVVQSCLTLSVDCSLRGSSAIQSKKLKEAYLNMHLLDLEYAAFSKFSSVQSLSRVRLFATA